MWGRLFISGKIIEDVYNSYGVNGGKTSSDRTDTGSPLEEKRRSTLLQILAKEIIVDSGGQIINYILNSQFTYLRSLVDNLFTPSNGEDGPEQIRIGATLKK